MPKILTDIQNTILTSAENLFNQRGFQQTDMREIAVHAQIAVGTIYHYYKNKQDLFMHVMAHSWHQTIQNLEKISQGDITPEQKLINMLNELSRGMANRRSMSSLWTEISTMYAAEHQHMVSHSEFNGMHSKIANYFAEVFQEMTPQAITPQSQTMIDQLGSFAFVMSVDLCMLTEAESRVHIELICDLLITYMQKKANE
ncbi:MAG: helix-turn-helix transcriptional regulator [Anaerolineaceae bacterium]|nr:helix-turn-helix transcriptional regulator [Anaerolineaceae bacterium]